MKYFTEGRAEGRWGRRRRRKQLLDNLKRMGLF